MKRTELLFVIVLFLFSCTQQRYFVNSESELSQIDWNNNFVNYVPLADNELKNSIILDSTFKLLRLKKYSKLKKFLSSIQSNNSDLHLAKTLYHISRTEYKEAENSLKMINENQYSLVKELLSIDISYEIAKMNDSEDFNKILTDYQKLIDKYPDNEVLKKIVALRIRHVRYNYLRIRHVRYNF